MLEQLASASQICPLPPGVDVVVQGAPAHAFYAVIDGGVVVHRDGEEVAHLGPGDYFGERGLLDNAPRNATVTTEEQSTVLRLEGDVLLDALQSAPTVLSAIDRSQRAGADRRVAGRARPPGGRPDVGGSVSVDGATVVGRRRRLRGQAPRSTSGWPSSARGS